MAGATTSQRTAAVPAMAPGAVRLSLPREGLGVGPEDVLEVDVEQAPAERDFT